MPTPATMNPAAHSKYGDADAPAAGLVRTYGDAVTPAAGLV